MKVAVVWATPEVQDIVDLELPDGSTVADAVSHSGLVEHYGIDAALLGYAIYGRRCAAATVLSDGDRIELTRPLEADPKSARTARARRQRASARPSGR